ncbi:MAG: tetratricopeptide repeat protein [Magnetococcales bacterium]|nr:tetratricopeptide repeat protein [Magnetococcales bacterium]
MILTIRHLGKGAQGERFVVERGSDGRRAEEAVLAGLESLTVPGRPTSDLRQDLRWYLEKFLEYPFSPYSEAAEAVWSTLEKWGADCFKRLFGAGNAAIWYGEARRAGLNNLTLRIASDDPVVLAWPWEALFDADDGVFLAHSVGVERQLGGKLRDPPELPGNLPRDRLNILLVIARPGGDQDVGYHAVARPLVALARKHPWVRVDLLRPPTFDQLRHLLEERPGFYHIVHFDGHGGYGVFGGHGPYTYDHEAQGLLVFEDDEGKAKAVMAKELNNLLAKHRIPFMVLNACRAAAVDERARDPFAATAPALIRAGVRGVVAMGYNLYVSGAQVFIPAFYERLFRSGSIIEATRSGREAMVAHPERDCSRGRFPLQDWLLPVLYQQEAPVLPFQETASPTTAEETVVIPEEAQVPGDFGFIGRERAILGLERALRNQPQRAILIHGMAGVGKTALAQGLLEWLAQTNGLKYPPFWFAFDKIRSAEFVINRLTENLFGLNATAKPLEEKIKAVVAALREHPYLQVWDNFESASGIEGTAITPMLSTSDRQILLRLIQGMAGGKSRILITSRSREAWLPITACYPLPLGGLQGEERWEFCNAVVKLLGLKPKREDSAFQELMEKLDGHPLAMRAVLLRLNEASPARLLKELEKGLEGKGGDESTEKIYKALGMFEAGLPGEFGPVLQWIGLHQGFVVLSDVENMAKIAKLAVSRSLIDACFSALEKGGMLHHLGRGIHRMHPALTGFLTEAHPPQLDVLQGFVTSMAMLADRFAPKPQHEQRRVFAWHEENFHRALALAPKSKDETDVPALTQSLAAWAQNNRDWVEAARLFQAFADYAHKQGHEEGEAAAYHQLGMIAEEQRDWTAAETWYQKSLEINERLGNEADAASTYHQLGKVAREQRQWTAAETWSKKSLEIKERCGNEYGAAITYHQLGMIAAELLIRALDSRHMLYSRV